MVEGDERAAAPGPTGGQQQQAGQVASCFQEGRCFLPILQPPVCPCIEDQITFFRLTDRIACVTPQDAQRHRPPEPFLKCLHLTPIEVGASPGTCPDSRGFDPLELARHAADLRTDREGGELEESFFLHQYAGNFCFQRPCQGRGLSRYEGGIRILQQGEQQAPGAPEIVPLHHPSPSFDAFAFSAAASSRRRRAKAMRRSSTALPLLPSGKRPSSPLSPAGRPVRSSIAWSRCSTA